MPHAVQLEAPPAEYVPTVQGRELMAAAAQDRPASHALHAGWPTRFWYLPLAQVKHARCWPLNGMYWPAAQPVQPSPPGTQ
jgi:hypothetical protein